MKQSNIISQTFTITIMIAMTTFIAVAAFSPQPTLFG